MMTYITKSELKWSPVQRWLHRPQFAVDKRVFVVLQYTECQNVMETIRSFKRQFRIKGNRADRQ